MPETGECPVARAYRGTGEESSFDRQKIERDKTAKNAEMAKAIDRGNRHRGEKYQNKGIQSTVRPDKDGVKEKKLRGPKPIAGESHGEFPVCVGKEREGDHTAKKKATFLGMLRFPGIKRGIPAGVLQKKGHQH